MNRLSATKSLPADRPSRLAVRRLGLVAYPHAESIQRAVAADRLAGRVPDTVLLLEHPPTITLGRGANPAHVLASPETLAARGVALVETDRGGDVTYHAPGQLVAYPIIDLTRRGRDLHRYLRDLEALLIDTVGAFGVDAGRILGRTGVWTRQGKIAAIGVKVARWVTTHGVALNADIDLAGFDLIIPCGIRDASVTSLSRERGRPVTVAAVAPVLEDRLRAVLEG